MRVCVFVLRSPEVTQLALTHLEEVDAADTPPIAGGIDIHMNGLANALPELVIRQIRHRDTYATERGWSPPDAIHARSAHYA